MTDAGWRREVKPMQMRAIPAMDRGRFMAKVIPVPESGCWIWEGSLCRGYGSVCIDGKAYRAHRVSYQMHKGEIPEGLTIDHLCRVRCCVNPDHLEAVTNKENILRGTSPTAHNRRKTHCINGHELVPGNLKWNRNQFRQCHMCALQADRKPFAIANADKTHCIRGHEYTPENTRVLVRRSNGRETRYCKLCQKIRNEQAASKRIRQLAQAAQDEKPTKEDL